jgi:uncharacterized protein YggU (UPF0235/DUF167 family)
VLKVPKSDVEITRGMKSREKTVAIHSAFDKNVTPQKEIERIKAMLQESVIR